MSLTIKQEKFAVAYVRLGNASAAYREAYEPKMGTDKTVNEEASRLLAHPKIAARVAELTKPAIEAAGLVAKLTLQHIAAAAYSTPIEPPTWSEKLTALDKAARIDGLYEKDNRQRGPDLALQVVLIGPP